LWCTRSSNCEMIHGLKGEINNVVLFRNKFFLLVFTDFKLIHYTNWSNYVSLFQCMVYFTLVSFLNGKLCTSMWEVVSSNLDRFLFFFVWNFNFQGFSVNINFGWNCVMVNIKNLYLKNICRVLWLTLFTPIW
jgi:hypothetical protein